MSRENVEVVHRLVEAWNEGNLDAVLALFDADSEVVFPPDVPEPGPFHGHAELRQWAEGFLAAWESHHVEVVETVDAGDSVIAVAHMVVRGKGSGIETDQTDNHVFAIRAGRIVRWQNFNLRAEALEAVGRRV
jgi:ketosteroid isomerase-like protein